MIDHPSEMAAFVRGVESNGSPWPSRSAMAGLVPLLGDFSADEPVAIHAVYPHRRHLAPKVPAFGNFLLKKFTPPPWEI